MGTDSRRAEVADRAEGALASATRLRAARPSVALGEASSDTSLAAALLANHEKQLRTLGFGLAAATMQIWRDECRRSPLLAQEEADYLEPMQRAIGPLFECLGSGRAELAELHAGELFNELRTLSLTMASVFDIIAAFERACSLTDPGSDPATAQVLGRFLTCTAVSAFSNTSAPVLTESSERCRTPRVRLRRLVGDGGRMRALRAELEGIANAPGSVLIVGESGTGKELVAEGIHALGAFQDQPFIAVNCAALPRELIESELFGYERGAFTGSRESSLGLLRAAGRGTVFLDEITEMPEALQPKLLRALEQRAVRPVGGLREIPISARIIAATNADPEHGAKLSGIRADLFYRLCVHRVDVPPLTERLEDIPLLVTHFLIEIERRGHRVPSAFSAASLAIFATYPWAGNVRELRNVVEHSCATAKGGVVEPRHLPQRMLKAESTAAGSRTAASKGEPGAAETLPLRDVERRHIEHVLLLAGGNKARAARLLGLSRHQLYLRLERLGLCDER